ncbi:MAG: MoaD/ThiS family protein [Desulfobacteraceae bacterium]|nr:MoaD/ThiS family protein [Desulfobacteraceae bacterium]
MGQGVRITVRARIVGHIDGRSVHASGEVELKAGITIREFFKRADASMGLKKQKPFKRAFKQGVRPMVLLNGDRIELPEEETHALKDGDEVTVILALAGG